MSLAKLGNPTNRFTRIGAGLSQLLNVILFNGTPSETISSRVYRRGILQGSNRWILYSKVINTIFFWQDDHCRSSYEISVLFCSHFLDGIDKN